MKQKSSGFHVKRFVNLCPNLDVLFCFLITIHVCTDMGNILVLCQNLGL